MSRPYSPRHVLRHLPAVHHAADGRVVVDHQDGERIASGPRHVSTPVGDWRGREAEFPPGLNFVPSLMPGRGEPALARRGFRPAPTSSCRLPHLPPSGPPGTAAAHRPGREPAAVVLAHRDTKNKKGARRPLPFGVPSQSRVSLLGKKPGRPVWLSTPCGWFKNAAGMLRKDLAAAGVPYCVQYPDGPRYADFHALRHSFLTALAGSGVGVKELQELARHSTPNLTLGVYTHTRPEQLGAAVARLPLPGENPNTLATMTRERLETLATVLLNLLAGLFAPPLAPAAGTPGDSQTLTGTKSRRRRAG